MPDLCHHALRRNEAHIHFDEAYFARLRKWDDFWWHRAIMRLVTRLAASSFPGLTFDAVADIRCGTGALLRTLEGTLHPRRLVGMDVAQAGLLLARRDFH